MKHADFCFTAAVEIAEDYPLFQPIYRVTATDQDSVHGDRLTVGDRVVSTPGRSCRPVSTACASLRSLSEPNKGPQGAREGASACLGGGCRPGPAERGPRLLGVHQRDFLFGCSRDARARDCARVHHSCNFSKRKFGKMSPRSAVWRVPRCT